jgi:hypothetical protein
MKKGFKFYASLAMFVWSVIAVISITWFTFSRSWDAGQYTLLIFMIAAYTLIGGTVLRWNLLRKGA